MRREVKPCGQFALDGRRHHVLPNDRTPVSEARQPGLTGRIDENAVPHTIIRAASIYSNLRTLVAHGSRLANPTIVWPQGDPTDDPHPESETHHVRTQDHVYLPRRLANLQCACAALCDKRRPRRRITNALSALDHTYILHVNGPCATSSNVRAIITNHTMIDLE